MQYKVLIVLLVCLLHQLCNIAQPIQSPSDFLGYPLGSRFTYHHRMVDYFEYVAANSRRVKLQTYGYTQEGRPLIFAAVSNEANIRNLEEIRRGNLFHTGLHSIPNSNKQLATVLYGYNVHGNEAVGMEAAMATLYALVAQDTAGWLNDMLVLLDPCINPDGRDRYGMWYAQVAQRRANPNPSANEHYEPWPGGRFNHYIFDLNRDWCWQTQIETKQRIDFYQNWMPHVYVDFHEMGPNSPFFFGPSAKPFHNVITPWQRTFHSLAGEYNSSYFDKNGWLYFTKEVYDLLYPSYGDTWSTYNGAVGFTYEQGGSGRAGRALIVANGDTLTLYDRLAHHFTSGWATLQAAHVNRKRMLEEFNAYFKETQEKGSGQYKTFVIKKDVNPSAMSEMLRLLGEQQIQHSLYQGVKRFVSGFSYKMRKEVAVSLEAGDVLISTHQPLGKLVQVLMEPTTYLEDTITYDLTAWSLPYVYGIEAFAIKDKINGEGRFIPRVSSASVDKLKIPYAWALPWKDLRDARLLAKMLAKGCRIRLSEQSFTSDNKVFDAGTVIAVAGDNPVELFRDSISIWAGQIGCEIYPLATGMVDQGHDMGSGDVPTLNAPRIGLINGRGVGTTDFGEVWHYLEQDLDYPMDIINIANFRQIDLDAYNLLILPSGSYGSISEDLVEYVEKGGRIIALEGAINTFTTGDEKNPPLTGLGKALLKNRKEDKADKGEEDTLAIYAERERKSLSDDVAGSIYAVTLDGSHPLSFGLPNPFYLMKTNSEVYPYLPEGNWNVGILRGDAHVSGFTGYKLRKKLQNSLAFGVEEIGDGKIIYFSDSPIIRQFWHSGKLLLANAIFFVQ